MTTSVSGPLVTLLLPVRNGLPWLGAALASIFGQTFADFELIVLEDGSTDGTPELLTRVDDPRLRIIETGGVGIARALNTGLEAARGAYIARHDADDESLPTRLADQVAVLESRVDIDVVATVAEYIDASGQAVDNAWVQRVRRQQDAAVTPDAIDELMALTCCITHGSILARADVLRSVGGYRPEMEPAEDYDLWLRLLPRHRFIKLERPLYRYRIHGDQSGARTRERQTRHAVLAKLQHVRRLYPALPTPARLGIVGSGRGDAYYQAMAEEAGFALPEPANGLLASGDWDVLAVTDFDSIAQYREKLSRGGEASIDLVGNLFVKRVSRQ
jgi:glycosyltransferase involved in cell wall biosynthesis